jgi:uncharacterized protein YjbI with pentapeptide repeats
MTINRKEKIRINKNNVIISNPEAIISLVLIIGILFVLYFFDDWQFAQDHFPGLMLDIVVFGILIVLYKKIWDIRIERRTKIQRWQEEIDDYRYWSAREASFRILGIVRRLKKAHFYEVDLSNCYFIKTNLADFDFSFFNLESAQFIKSDLRRAIFSNSRLRKTNFTNSDISNSHFCKSDIWNIHFINSDISFTKFEDINSGYGRGAGYFHGGFAEDSKMQHCSIRDSSFVDFNFKQVGLNKSKWNNTNFLGCSFIKSTLTSNLLDEASLEDCLFSECLLNDSVFNNTKINSCKFVNCNFKNAIFKNTILKKTITYSNVHSSEHINEFINCDLTNTIFDGTDLSGTVFPDTILDEVNLINTIGLTAMQFKKTKSMNNIIIENRLFSEIRQINAHLYSDD